MDLESYALTAEHENDRSVPSPDIKGKGKQREEDAGVFREEEEDVTLEADVRHIANSVSSWWSGFSKKTQEQLASAQTRIADQGGIVQFARNEAAKIEAQLEDTRKEAKAQREAQDVKERSEKRNEQAAEGEAAHPSGGEAAPRSDKPDTGIAPSETASSGEQSASTSTLLQRLQTMSTDPRVASLQSDVTQRLSTLFSQSNTQTQNLSRSVQAALQDASTSLRQLSKPEGKAYAQRYLQAGQDLMGKAGEEWKDMMGELVKVVPAEEASNGKAKGETTAGAGVVASRSDTQGLLAAETTDSDAFSWEDAATDGGHSKDSSAPSQVDADELRQRDDKEQPKGKAEEVAAKAKAKEDDSDDSDWE